MASFWQMNLALFRPGNISNQNKDAGIQIQCIGKFGDTWTRSGLHERQQGPYHMTNATQDAGGHQCGTGVVNKPHYSV